MEEKAENKETNVVLSFKTIGDFLSWGQTIHIMPRNKYIYITDKGDEIYSDGMLCLLL